MGSSRVTMWTSLVALMWSIMAERLVVFPEPVGPVTRMRPRGSSESERTTGGRPSCSMPGDPTCTRRNTKATEPRWRKALTRKRPTPVTE